MDLDKKQQVLNLLSNKLIIDRQIGELIEDDSILDQAEELIDLVAKKHLLLNPDRSIDEIEDNLKELAEEPVPKGVPKKPNFVPRPELMQDIEDM